MLISRICRLDVGPVLRIMLCMVVSGGFTFHAAAAWITSAPLQLVPNVGTTVTLMREPDQDGQSTGTSRLWLMATGRPELLIPETVSPANDTVSLSVFPRGEGSGELVVYDTDTRSTSAISWTSNPESNDDSPWVPRLDIQAPDNLPVAYANQKVTATLTLFGGAGEMPPTAHISVRDKRGRLVVAEYFPTFDLLAGAQTFSFPAAGYYDMSLKLLRDPVTSYPRLLKSEPIPIPFGKTLADIEQPAELPDGVSTTTVIGTFVTLEELPTTATVVAEDRMRFSIFGKHSREIQRNRWPFGIAGANLTDIPVREHETRGTELLIWQRRLGSSFASVNLKWEDIQKHPGRFYYGTINSVLKNHRRRMVRPIITLTGKAAWDDTLPVETTATREAWIRFTGDLSENFTKLMWGLQVWDDPIETWTDPEGYRKTIEATLTGFTMRDGQPVPAPPVIIGGTDGVNTDYLSDAMTSETAPRLSLSFNFTPPDYQDPPTQSKLSDEIDKAAGIFEKHGAPGRPIYISDIGYPNGPGGVTAELQANYLVRAYVLAMSKDVYKIMWDSLYDRSEIPWDEDLKSRTGLLDTTLTPKLSGVAYNIMSYMMSGATPDGVTSQGKAAIYKFNLPVQDNKWAGSVYVAWTESPNQVQDIRLEMTHGGGVYALDYLGAEVHARKVAEDSANSIVGSYQIPVGFEPVFIWDAGGPGRKD